MAGMGLISPLLYKPMVQARVGRVALPAWLAAALSAGLGAQLATAPILVMLTGQVSLVAPVATLFVDAALLPLMVAGSLAGILGWLLPWLAWFAGCASWLFAWWMTAWAAVWAALPFSSVSTGTVEVIWVLCYYAALAGAVALVRRQRRKSAREEA
jgi:competence protein ComEC